MHNPTNKNQELADYIKKNLEKGYKLDSLRFSLMAQGYSRITVAKSIELATKQIKNEQEKEKPKITYKILDEENHPIKTVEVDNSQGSFFEKLKIFLKDLIE